MSKASLILEAAVLRGAYPPDGIISLSRLRRASLAIATILLLTACQQQHTESPAEQSSTVNPTPSDPEINILGEGFYGEHPDESSDIDSKLATAGAPVIADSSPAKADSLPVTETTKTASIRDNIVEDFKFSTADDITVADQKQLEAKPYCLGIIQDKPPINDITTEQACLRISNRLASVTNKGCQAALLQPSQCHSVSGFPILVREFAPLPGTPSKGRILVLGGTHGDELTSVSIAFRWIEKLNKYHSGLFHWRIAPMMNPDGVLKRAASRTNQNGVDLNRNMPSDDWQANALKYWQDKQRRNPRRYPGEKAASEPETQWLIDEIETFKPDAIISVHAPFGVVDFDSLLLNTAPRSLGKLHLNLLGTYPGSLGNYAGINRNIPVITLELPHAWVMPSDTETTQIWEDIVSWLRTNVGQNVADSQH